jgi:lipid-binding SYLF domain-containing protein
MKESKMEASARFLVHGKSLMARGVAMQAGQSAARSLLRRLASIVALAAWAGLAPTPAVAQDYGLEGKARYALSSLAATVPLAAILEKRAYAILVFPDVTKAGFLIGWEYGNGVLFRRGGIAGYYNTAGVSYGLQAGAETFGYAMFFMNESAFQALNAQEGFQIGAGPSVVVLDQGMSKTITSSSLTSDVYAFVFGQQGLMGGVGLEGTKITRLNR